MNILWACLLFIGNSIAGGVTWDVLKQGGGYLVQKFLERFGKFFASKGDARRYLQLIAEKEVYDEEDPFRDAVLIYKKVNQHGDMEKFEQELKRWMRENSDAFQCLPGESGVKMTGLSIGTQNVFGGTVINTGIEKR